jgi:hypothetical protein
MPELLTLSMQLALAACVAIAAVFYAHIFWTAIADRFSARGRLE